MESPLDSQVGVASLVLDVGVEFLASGGRTALGVSEPPVAVQFLDGLTDRVARVMLGESTVAMLPISSLCVNWTQRARVKLDEPRAKGTTREALARLVSSLKKKS